MCDETVVSDRQRSREKENCVNNSAENRLHPVTILIYVAGTMGIPMFYMHPFFVLLSLGLALAAGWMLKGVQVIKMALGLFVPVLFFSAVILPLFSHNGAHPLFYVNGLAVTRESVQYGVVMSLFLVAVFLWFQVASALLDGEKIRYLTGRLIPSIGLMLTMVFRMLPLLRRRYREICEAQDGLGFCEETGSAGKIRRTGRKISTLISWSLEDAVETSVSMECRGYGTGRRTNFHLFRFHTQDGILGSVLVLCFLLAAVLLVRGELKAVYFPTAVMTEINVWNGMGMLLFLVAALTLPLWIRISRKWESV